MNKPLYIFQSLDILDNREISVLTMPLFNDSLAIVYTKSQITLWNEGTWKCTHTKISILECQSYRVVLSHLARYLAEINSGNYRT